VVKQRTGDILRSADRLLQVLGWFSEERPSGTAGEIATGLGVAPATIRRLLVLLESHSYVQRDRSTGAYRVGYAPMRLAAIVHGADPLVSAAASELDRLNAEFGELVFLGALDGGDVAHIEARESTYELRIHLLTRRLRANEGGATGTALLAWLPTERVRELFSDEYEEDDGDDRYRVLEAMLAATRERGYALSERSVFAGRWSVASPIRVANGDTVAAICLAAPSFRAQEDRQKKMIAEVMSAAELISSRLAR
jgi:DNA-binding IclR family transcriptional regulator